MGKKVVLQITIKLLLEVFYMKNYLKKKKNTIIMKSSLLTLVSSLLTLVGVRC
jgi:hypothetical protein